ncbi:gamma-glutamyltransferase [Anaerolineales bacterium HSG24]|nr:gamma-glutamyltransferase [Anaerolineales bacterium HSG24]
MHGVISAGHPETANAGAIILKQGGNAVDAAVAASFASFIAESPLVNIGGGGIAQLYNPATKQPIVYDFFSTMPGLNGSYDLENIDFRQIFIDFGPAQQPFYIGRASVAVPGVVAGLCQMATEAGRLPLSEILSPAIQLAKQGATITNSSAYVMELLEPILTDTPPIAQIYTPQGRLPTVGEKLYFSDLAKTMAQIGQSGANLFYRGSVAQKIATDQTLHHGLLTKTDLASYHVISQTPISVFYRGYTILLPPPASIGGVLIAFALHLLTQIPLSTMTHNSFEHLRILTEVMRLTNISRPEWEAIYQQVLHSQTTTTAINEAITKFLSPARIADYQTKLRQTLAGESPLPEPEPSPGPSNTTHISVADADGMLVTITTSSGENAGFIVDDTGVMLNNMLGEIDLHPNGFHQLPAGQRLTTMMCPVLVLKDGEPILAAGSGGSNRIRSAILQLLSNVIDFKLPLEQAVNAARVHFEAGTTQLEGGILPAVADQFETFGYNINRWPKRNMFFGGAHAVARTDSDSQTWTAAGDKRRGGTIEVV